MSVRSSSSWLHGVMLLLACTSAAAAEGITLGNVACQSPPPAHCGASCDAAHDAMEGNAVEPVSGRRFFLDYPCDLKKNERVIFVLSLHGAGSIGNRHRHYFPVMDFKDKYRLVIATPSAKTPVAGADGTTPVRMWRTSDDDAYLQGISDYVIGLVGAKNVQAFWLAGHSQGGMTSNRLVCNAYFRDRADGWLSLSGGRLGIAEIVPDFFGPAGPPAALNEPGPDTPRPGIATLPDCDISYIFATGELEVVGLPATSPWAEKYRCDKRVRRDDIVDTQKGYISTSDATRGPSWGREARPGTAQLYEYPGCRQRRVVADVLRLDKGHTEGLEPKVTEAIVRLMVKAPGGKVRALRD